MEERAGIGGSVPPARALGGARLAFDPTDPRPSVGIATVNWNGWRDTLELLTSIERLAYPNFRIVVVDNGSVDGSEQHLRQEYPNLTIVQTGRNLGYPGGANVGARVFLEAGADFIWLINNDMVVEKDALSAMVEVARRDSAIGLVGSVVYHYHDRERVQFWGGAEYHRWTATTRNLATAEAGRLDYIGGASLLVRSALLRSIGLLNEQLVFYWDDVEFSLRARRAGWRLAVAEASRVFHKEGNTVGYKSPRADYLETESLTVFLFEQFGLLGIGPLVARTLGKVFNRIARRQPSHLWSTCRGLAAGVRRLVRPVAGIQ